MKWYLKALRQYFDFTGRARRTEFWMFVWVSCVIAFVLAVLDRVLELAPAGNFGGGPLNTVYQLATVVPTLAAGARRLHDVGHSGWWQLAPAAPFALLLVPGLLTSWELALIGYTVWFGVSIAYVAYLATSGDPDPNKWGFNPKSNTETAAAD